MKLLNTCQLLSNRQRNLVRPHLRSDVISFFKVHHPPTLSNEIFPKWRLKVRENLFHLQYNPVVSRLETQDLATIMKPHVCMSLAPDATQVITQTGDDLVQPSIFRYHMLVRFAKRTCAKGDLRQIRVLRIFLSRAFSQTLV